MSINKNIKEHSGEWFIPEIRLMLSGVLIIDSQEYNQKLKLFSKVDFEGLDLKNGHPKDVYKTIFGNCEFDSQITLSDCRFQSLKKVGENLYELVYLASMSFFGGLFKDADNLEINELTCRFPYLSSWYDTNRIYFGTGSFNDSTDWMKPSFALDELNDEIIINENLTIVIERRYDDLNLGDTRKLSQEVSHFVHFKSKIPRSLNDFIKSAHIFMQLIKLSTGKLMYIDFVSCIPHKDEIQAFDKHFLSKSLGEEDYDYVFISITNFNKIHKRELIKSDYIHQGNMLFYGGSKENKRLKEIIIRWFNAYEKISSVYNIFLDTFEWFQNTDALLTEVMFNNRFVNLIQAIENYYSISEADKIRVIEKELENKKQKIIESIPDKNDKDWLKSNIHCHMILKDKLKDLLGNKIVLISNEIFENPRKRNVFIEIIKNNRNRLSHGENREISIDKLFDYYHKTLIILISCILDSLNFSQQEIKENLFRTLKYGNMIYQIKCEMKK